MVRAGRAPKGDAIARVEERGERSVLLRSRGGFLGAHPKRVCLDLQIVTDQVIPAPRVTKVDPVSARRFQVHVRLANERRSTGSSWDGSATPTT